MKRSVPILAALLFPILLFGQEPTYEQTQKWVISQITDEGGEKITVGSLSMMSKYENVSMSECNLKYTRVLFTSSSLIGRSVTRTSVIIPLDKVVAVTSKERLVALSLSAKVIVAKSTEFKGSEMVSQEDFPASDKETIKFIETADASLPARVQKALTYAISLCKKTKEKEPF